MASLCDFPGGAVVTGVEITFRIDDYNGTAGCPDGTFYCGDYAVWVSKGAYGPDVSVYGPHWGGRCDDGYDCDSESDSDIYVDYGCAGTCLSDFDGQDPADWWYIYVEDQWSGDEGKIDWVGFLIYYELPCTECPNYDQTLSAPATNWQTATGSVASGGCYMYRVSLQSGHEYTFKTGCGDGAWADFDTVLDVFRPSGDCPDDPTWGNDDDCDLQSRVVFTATSSGYHYVRVSGYGGEGGNYTLAYRGCATEICNGIDDDCDGQVDEEGASGCTTYYRDHDNDTYGVTGDTKCLCAPSGEYDATRGGDCDDNCASCHPGGTEVCDDGRDNDCDGALDAADTADCPPEPNCPNGACDSGETPCNCPQDCGAPGDSDDDGVDDCRDQCPNTPAGDTVDSTGCPINPCPDGDRDEDGVCDGDDNCPDASNAGQADCDKDGIGDACDQDNSGCTPQTWYRDADGDGYGDPYESAWSVNKPEGYVSNNDDCDDDCASCHPGGTEVDDGRDNDCDGQIDPYPVADAGAAQHVHAEAGTAFIELDGSGSSGHNLQYEWAEGGVRIATGSVARVRLGVGTHYITLTVTDDQGRKATDTMSVVVEEQVGACCLAGGDCQVLTATDCQSAGGTYQGDETECDPNPCPCVGCACGPCGSGAAGAIPLAFLTLCAAKVQCRRAGRRRRP